MQTVTSKDHVSNGRGFGRVLTYRELAQRSRVPGLYTPTVGGFVRAFRDMRDATPLARFLLGNQAMDAVREVRALNEQ
jgi:hypothetical protein